MSGEEQNDGAPDSARSNENEVSISDLRAFLTAKGASWTCPVCSTLKWSAAIETNSDHHVPSLLGIHKTSGELIGADVVQLTLLICDNCGYIRTFSRSAILRWKSEQSEAI